MSMWRSIFLIVCTMQIILTFCFGFDNEKGALGALERGLGIPEGGYPMRRSIPARPKPRKAKGPLTTRTPAYFVGENTGDSETSPILLTKAQGDIFPVTKVSTLRPPHFFSGHYPMTLPSFEEMPADPEEGTSEASQFRGDNRVSVIRSTDKLGMKRPSDNKDVNVPAKLMKRGSCTSCGCKHDNAESVKRVIKVETPSAGGLRKHLKAKKSLRTTTTTTTADPDSEFESPESDELSEEQELSDELVSKAIKKLSIAKSQSGKGESSQMSAMNSNLADASTQTDPLELLTRGGPADGSWSRDEFFKRLDALSNLLLKRYGEVLRMESEVEGDRALLRSVIESLAKDQKLVRIDTRLVRVDVELQMAIRAYKGLRVEKEKIEAALADVEHYVKRLQMEKTKIIDLILEKPEMEEKVERARLNLDRRAKFANRVKSELKERYPKVVKEVQEAREAIDKLEAEKLKLETAIKALEQQK